jgi:UDP-N-acetylglucosamine acyltransferase
MNNIHPTAIVAKGAEIEGAEIGPYAIIGENVRIKKGTKIGPHCVIIGWTEIGKDCDIKAGVVIGEEPQIRGAKPAKSYVMIGDGNAIREYTTIHRSSKEEEVTRIGNNNFIMAGVHIAHDCIIGDNVTITNYAGLTGHIYVEDCVVISGLVAIHQFVRIGRLAMIGGGSKVVQDVPPYIMVDGHPAEAVGLNSVGLARNGIPSKVRSEIKKAYRLLYRSHLNVSQALKRIEEEIPKSAEIVHFVEFIKASERGIC